MAIPWLADDGFDNAGPDERPVPGARGSLTVSLERAGSAAASPDLGRGTPGARAGIMTIRPGAAGAS
jgi:hypothetical protein